MSWKGRRTNLPRYSIGLVYLPTKLGSLGGSVVGKYTIPLSPYTSKYLLLEGIWTPKNIPKTPETSQEVLLMEEILHHLRGLNPVNNGINYQPQMVQDFNHQQYGWVTITTELFWVQVRRKLPISFSGAGWWVKHQAPETTPLKAWGMRRS